MDPRRGARIAGELLGGGKSCDIAHLEGELAVAAEEEGEEPEQVEQEGIARFATAEKLASYAGTTPRVHASGGKTRFGRSRPNVNRYLK